MTDELARELNERLELLRRSLEAGRDSINQDQLCNQLYLRGLRGGYDNAIQLIEMELRLIRMMQPTVAQVGIEAAARFDEDTITKG